MNRFIAQILPTPIYLEICDLDLSSELKFIENIPFSLKQQEDAKEFGDQSSDTYILNNPEMKNLRNWILERVEDYARNIMLFDVENMALCQSWISRKIKGQGHKIHSHSNSLISGVFYWQDKIEPINFIRQDTYNFAVEDLPMSFSQDPLNAKQMSASISPKKKSLILFPSTLAHFVEHNPFDQDRFSLSFNSIPLKGLGQEDYLNELNLSKIYGKS